MYVNEVQDCESTVMIKGELGKKDFVKVNPRRESNFCAFSGALHKRDILTVLRRQMSSSHYGSFHLSSKDVLLEATHSVLT